MDLQAEEISVNGIAYIKKDAIKEMAVNAEGLKYVIVRTYSAGVFAGYIKERNGQEGVVLNARRLWYWDGAASLSQLAIDGVSKPENCKFPAEVSEITLTQIIEILPVSKKAEKSIKAVKVWSM